MNNGYGEAPQVQEESSIQFSEIVATLFRHKWIVIVATMLSTLGTFAWIATRTPEFSARATLLLESDASAGGVLGELASLTSDPTAKAEIALITSHSLASSTAASPAKFNNSYELFEATAPDFDPFARSATGEANFKRNGPDPTTVENLGLAWKVDRYDLMPMSGLLATMNGVSHGKHRLKARIEPIGADDAERPEALDVEFSKDGSRVIVGRAGNILGLGEVEGKDFAYEPGAELRLYNWSLTLTATGDFAGERYRVERIADDKLVGLFMERISARESGRKTNIVYVNVKDSDPYRAAETANAICKNYIRRSVRIGQQKATQTVRFIEAQLEQQLLELAAAEREVVRLQTENPSTIALSVTATALIEQASALELQITQTKVMTSVIREALEYMERGDFESLARLGAEMPNLLALGYIKELSTLEAESLRLDRTDVMGYKGLLLGERQRVRGLLEASDMTVAELSSIHMALKNGEAGAVARAAAASDGFTSYLTELAKIDSERSRLRGIETESSPKVRAFDSARAELMKRLVEQVASTLEGARAASKNYTDLAENYSQAITEWPAQERGNIDAAVASLRKSLRTTLERQVDGLSSRLKDMDGQRQAFEDRLGELPEAELALAKPIRERETRGRIVEFLLTSQHEATITAAATSAAAVLIDPALPPRSRLFPRVGMLLLSGALAGLLAGCGLALLHNQLRGALFSEAEVERVSGLSVFGSVPNYMTGRTRIKGIKKGSRFLPMRDQPESPQAEAYRQIRASVSLAMDGGDSLRTLAVTSSVPGEGKTVTNADLAMVFAASGKRVLLVDCDLRKPQVHNIFDLERGPGFAEVLEGKADWHDCVNANMSNGLNVITAGRCEARPGELLASAKALAIVDELKQEFDLIVFDLPPAVVVADVANFANKLDAVLMLYRSGEVPGKLLVSAAKRLRRWGIEPLGVIINAVVVQRTPGGYGYGDSYGYEYEYSEKDKS